MCIKIAWMYEIWKTKDNFAILYKMLVCKVCTEHANVSLVGWYRPTFARGIYLTYSKAIGTIDLKI